jgi:hypothetical protein
MIDNEVEETKEITLEGRSSGEVTFGVSRSVPGLYLVSVNGVPGSFAVVESVVVEGAQDTPASFSTSGLSVSPAEVSAEGEVTISILVSNSGDLAGSYEVTLMIDNEVEETKEITLEGRSSGEVTFGVSRSVPGLYLVSVNGVPGSFAVVESVVVEGAQDTPAASTQIGEPVSSPIQPGTTNWWLIGAIFTADTILLVIIVMWLLKRRRKARQAEKEQAVTSYDLQMLPDKELRE